MAQPKERLIKAPDDLLSVDDVAERLLVSRAAVYRLVSRRDIPLYRLPSGLRFKVADVDVYLERCRHQARPLTRYGRSQG